MTADLPAALFVKSASESAIESLPLAQGFAEVTDSRPGANGVCRLLVWGQFREVGAKGVHGSEDTFW